MTDEQTDTTDTTGEEANKPTEEDKTPSQKLKEENDSLQFELERAQKIRNEALLSGTSGGHIEAEVKTETPKEYSDKVMKGEIK